MQKTKIAFFAEILIEDFDGASRTMFQLLKRIPHDRFEFLFICGVGPEKLFEFDCVCLPTIPLPMNKGYRMAFPLFSKSTIRQKVNAFAPDVVHIATPSMLGEFGLEYAAQKRLPVLSIYHTHFISYIDYYFRHLPFLIPFMKKTVTRRQKSFYNRCKLIYVPAKAIVEELVNMGVERPRMQLWQRGIDTNLFSPEKRSPDLMRRLTGNDRPTVLFLSRLVWEKNLATLFRIYDLMQQKNLPYNLMIAGDGEAEKTCREKMPQAVFTGKVDHTLAAELYASADVFLFPSVSESYGNVVLEAMASGLPCMIAAGGGSQDFIEQGMNGFKCSPYEEADYVEKIRKVLENKALWEQFSGRGRSYSSAFDWSQLAEVYFKDLQKLAR